MQPRTGRDGKFWRWLRDIADLSQRTRTVASAAGMAVLSLLAGMLVAFVISSLTPGDSFSDLELDPSVSAKTIALLRARYVPNQPLAGRFARWLVAATHGDLGYSISFHRSVTQLLAERLPATLQLIALAFALAWAAGLVTGLALAALGEGRVAAGLRAFASLAACTIASMPTAVVAIAALLLAPPAWLNTLTAPGAGGSLSARHITSLPWLPACVLAVGLVPAIYFQCLHALAAVLPRPFILAARARGNSKARVLARYALPNCFDLLVPLASVAVTQLLLECIIVETLLDWPGIGQLSIVSATQRDLPLLSALVLLTAVVVIAANLTSDFMQWRSNPRLREASN